MKWLCRVLFVVYATSIQAQPKVPVQPMAVATLSTTTKMINFRLSWNQTEVVDSTMVAVFLSRDTVPALYRRTKPIDTVSFSIPDDTTTYRFLLVSVRRGLASLPANVNYFFNADVYYQPTGIAIYPSDTTVLPGATVQYCGFLKFNDGTILIRQREKSVPKCVEYYNNKVPVASRRSGGAKQRIADKICLKWEVTGGKIEQEVCIP